MASCCASCKRSCEVLSVRASARRAFHERGSQFVQASRFPGRHRRGRPHRGRAGGAQPLRCRRPPAADGGRQPVGWLPRAMPRSCWPSRPCPPRWRQGARTRSRCCRAARISPRARRRWPNWRAGWPAPATCAAGATNCSPSRRRCRRRRWPWSKRAAARFFGLLTFASHMNGIVGDGDGRHRFWIARRSPPRRSTLACGITVAGGMLHGSDPLATLVRECEESRASRPTGGAGAGMRGDRGAAGIT